MKACRSTIATALVLVSTAAFAQSDEAILRSSGVKNEGSSKQATKAASPSMAANYGKLPLSFEANRGQTDPRVKFLSRGNGYSLFLTDKAAVLSIIRSGPNQSGCPTQADGSIVGLSGKARKPAGCPILSDSSTVAKGGIPPKPQSPQLKTDTVRMELVGANPDLHIEGTDQLPGIANYFIGKDPAKWHSNIPTYAKVKYSDVYPGVDLVYYGNQRQLEYDFVVAPGASPKPVKLHFAGAEKLKIDASGDLTVTAKNGEIAFHKPVVYQLKSGRLKTGERNSGQLEASQRELVDGRFVLLANNTIGFKLGSYDPSRELVIDPVLVYSTYLGGSDQDQGIALAVDSAGSAYVVGCAGSKDFPVTSDPFQPVLKGQGNAFVAKLNASGSALVYSTFLGGSNGDCGAGIAVDSSGDAYVTGGTYSLDFPVTPHAFQQELVNSQSEGVFVTELNPTGSALIYSTLLAGVESSLPECIAVDSSGNAYVGGNTQSGDFPTTPGAFQNGNRGLPLHPNAFLTKVNPTGSSLVYSTLIGGHGYSTISGVAVDASGDAYVAGFDYSTDFPVTAGAFQQVNHGAAIYNPNGSVSHHPNGFVTKFNASGSSLVYSTHLGGSGIDLVYGIVLDPSGNAYVSGTSSSSDFPVTAGAFQSANISGNPKGVVVKLDPTGSYLKYSTYLGGSNGGGSSIGRITIDAVGNVYATGGTGSTDFPVTRDALQGTNPEKTGSAFLTRLNRQGTALFYSSYLGGSTGGDLGSGIALDGSGNAYLIGSTSSTDFPVSQGAFQTVQRGLTSAFISKFSFPTDQTATSLISNRNPQLAGAAVTFSAGVTSASGSGTPTGKVGFSVDGGAAIEVTLDAGGNAAYTTSALSAGAHEVVASYSGDANYPASASSALTQSIFSAQAATPVFTPAAGYYHLAQTVTISDTVLGAAIYYTTDGTTPTTSSNQYSGPVSIPSTTSLKAIAVAQNYLPSAVDVGAYIIPSVAAKLINFAKGFAQVRGLVLNGSAGFNGTGLQLTTNGGLFQAGSAFYAAPVNVQSFTTDFNFQITNPVADGFTFTIQNSGPSALGGPGAGLGYVSIPNSVALKFDLYDNVGEGPNSTGIYIYGASPTLPSVSLAGSGIDLHSGDAIGAHLAYNGVTLTLTLTDRVAGATWSHSWTIDIPGTVFGSTAYVGFTGGTGGGAATQTITSWSYTPGAFVPNYPSGFDGVGLSLNGSSAVVARALQLTNGGLHQAVSAFYGDRVNIQSFTTDFAFQASNPVADGFTFTIQNNSPTALGGNGSGLGYVTIPRSVAIKFDLYNNAGEGPNSTGLFTAGNTPTVPAVDLTGTGIDLHSGDPIGVHMTYNGTVLAMTITDLTTKASYSHSWTIDLIPALNGNLAYVGFTGSTGGYSSTQKITSWTFVPGLPAN